MALSTSNMFVTQGALYHSIGFISMHIPVSFNYVSSYITKSLIFKIALVTLQTYVFRYSTFNRGAMMKQCFSNIDIQRHFNKFATTFFQIQVYSNTLTNSQCSCLAVQQKQTTSNLQIYGNTSIKFATSFFKYRYIGIQHHFNKLHQICRYMATLSNKFAIQLSHSPVRTNYIKSIGIWQHFQTNSQYSCLTVQ